MATRTNAYSLKSFHQIKRSGLASQNNAQNDAQIINYGQIIHINSETIEYLFNEARILHNNYGMFDVINDKYERIYSLRNDAQELLMNPNKLPIEEVSNRIISITDEIQGLLNIIYQYEEDKILADTT